MNFDLLNAIPVDCEDKSEFSNSLELMISHEEFVRIWRVPGDQGAQVITTKDCRFDLTGTGLLIKWVIVDLCNLSHIDSRLMPFVFFRRSLVLRSNTRPEQQEQRQRCWEGWTSSYGAWGGCSVAPGNFGVTSKADPPAVGKIFHCN